MENDVFHHQNVANTMENERFELKTVANTVEMAVSSSKILQIAWKMHVFNVDSTSVCVCVLANDLVSVCANDPVSVCTDDPVSVCTDDPSP